MKENVTLTNQLEVFQIQHIRQWEDLNKVLSFYIFDREGSPTILTKDKSVIIFDNSIYNRALLLDSFLEAWKIFSLSLEKERQVVKLYYIDDVDIRMRVFQPSLTKYYNLEQKTDTLLTKVETDLLSPALMVINPVMNHLVIYDDKWDTKLGNRAPDSILKFLNWLFSENRTVYSHK
jgi:hypothetical protein